MPIRSKFRSQRRVSVPDTNLKPFNFFDLKGLDMYNPDELMDDKRSPYLKNVRLFAPGDNTKRVAVSKRFGHTFYTVPVGETLNTQQTSVTGAANKAVDKLNAYAQPFTPSASGQLTKVDLNLANTASGTGPLLVKIYSDSSGSPGTLLATSSILASSFTGSLVYLSARFIEAPALVSGTQYWIVLIQQSPEGTGSYAWSSTTTATTAKNSIDGGNTWLAPAAYAMNFKTYISTAGGIKGIHRYYRSSASPVTMFAFGTDVYIANDGTGAVTSIKSGLSASASFYDFASVNDKTYWANGIDTPQVYDGSTVAAIGGSPPANLDNVEIHANRAFYLQVNTNYCIFSDAAAYETFGATSFLYIPSPKTADPAFKMVSFQGNMVFFSKNTKHVLYGTDLASFNLRESPAKKGAISATAIVKDENFIYFMAPDGLVYRYNGGTDQPLHGERVWAITKNMASGAAVKMSIADRKLIISIRGSGKSANDRRLVYDIVYDEWLSDEETYSDHSLVLGSQTDSNQLVVGSSLVGALYYGDTGGNDLGKPINAAYWTKYFSFGNPAAKHRVKRLYAFLRGQTTNHQVDVQVDVDEANAPTSNLLSVLASGAIWGTAVWAAFTWSNVTFLPFRISVPGANRKHQFRFVQNGVNNNMDILGYETYVQPRRAV